MKKLTRKPKLETAKVNKDTRKRVSKDMLRRFAAEIKRCTNFPLSDKIVEQVIKNFEHEEEL